MAARYLLMGTALLAGCLAAPGERQEENQPDGAPDQLVDALDEPGDGGAVGNDGGVAASDAAIDRYGVYLLTWTKTGGDCAGPDTAMDRAQVGVNYFQFFSQACPAVEHEQQGATWDADVMTTSGGFALENCAQTTYEDLPALELMFDGESFAVEISATRKLVSNNSVVCSIDLLIEGTAD